MAAGIEIVFIVLESGDDKVNGTSKSDVLLIAAVPNPRFVLAPDAVVAPVPPFANGSAPETLLVKSTVFNKSIHLLALAPVE